MRAIVVVCVLAACGGSKGKPEEPSNAADPAADAVNAERVCGRVLALKAEGCALFADYQGDATSCRKEYEETQAAGGQTAEMLRAFGSCFIEHEACGEVGQCIAKLTPEEGEGQGERKQGKWLKPRRCEDDAELGFVQYTPEQWEKRHGGKAVRFGDVASSKAQPIEVCDLQGQLEWLTHVTCADGKPAFADRETAHAARIGNVGKGGRCGGIIDYYQVKCPEKTYDVYMDMYACPAN